VDCYSCEQPAINACRRCARTYCEDHGNAQFCAECLRPASALPSFNLYRGALLTMLVGTALAVFLLLRPPGDTSGALPVVVGRSSATPESRETPQSTVRPETPRATNTAVVTPSATPESPFLQYVVQEGDSLFSIAQDNLPAGDDLQAYVEAIANLNGLDVNDPVLRVGQTLALPPQPAP
jgi:LysM repeat protein